MYEVNEPSTAVVDIAVAREARAHGATTTQESAGGGGLAMKNWLGLKPDEYALVERAAKILCEHREYSARTAITSSKDMSDYLNVRLGRQPYEVFGCLFLDNRHRVLGFEEVSHGTIDHSEAHPREVARLALQYNAAAVVLAHNHPSGVAEPSLADCNVTRQLRDALALIGVRVIDHVIVGTGEPTSMAARGLL